MDSARDCRAAPVVESSLFSAVPLPEDVARSCSLRASLRTSSPPGSWPARRPDQFAQPELGLAHLAPDVVLQAIHLELRLLGGPVRMAPQAGIFQHVPGAALAVEGVFLPLLGLTLACAVLAFHPGPLMLDPVGFHLGC